MLEYFTLHVLALIFVAAQFGGMAFFAFLFTPLVFKFVERDDAAKFLRQVFPVYHRVMAGMAIIPALILVAGHAYMVEVVSLLSVAAVFLFAAQVLVPMANSTRETGDQAKFSKIHRVSVILHTIQFIVVFVMFIRLAQ